MGEGRLKMVRATLRNAVVWGAAWGAAAFVTMLGLRTAGVMVPASVTWLDALGMAIRFGVVGGIAGAGFASVVRLVYRGRRLADISAARFAIGGALVGGVGVPLLMETLSVLTGGGVVPWSSIQTDVAFAALFGAIVAGGSMKLAQLAERRAPDDDTLLRATPVNELGAGTEVKPGVEQRSRQSAR